MRVVLDTSVVVAALLTSNAQSAARVVLAAAVSGAVDLVVTDDLEAEYRRAVEYHQVRKLAAKVDRQAFVSGVVAMAKRVKPSDAAGAVKADPKDDQVVAAALGGGAAYLLSFDAHLTELGSVGQVKTLRPGDFLAVLRAKD